MTDTEVNRDMDMPRLVPRNKISIPEVLNGSNANGSSNIAPPAEQANVDEDAPAQEEASGPAVAPRENALEMSFSPISPGLSNVALPLGPAPKGGQPKSTTEAPPEKKEEPVEAKVGDMVELFMGRGQVRRIREDGMLEVWSMGWEMAAEQRPRYYVTVDSVKVIPTVYYKMPVLERLQISAWLKEEGGRMFKAADFKGAAASYMKAVGVLKTCEFKSNAQNARALEVMIPCHNNAATCYIKIKNYGDARLLSENVDTLCSALERNKGGLVMKALKERGVRESTVLGLWWCKGLFLGGKACLYQSENDQAVACLKKGSKLAKPAALAKLRTEINTELDKATKRLANQTKKAQKMWTKAFSKNSTDTAPEEPAVASARELPQPQLQLNGGTDKSVLQRLEELSRMGNATLPPAPTPAKAAAEVVGEGSEVSEEESDEESDEDDEGEGEGEESQAFSSKGLLWGTLAVGVAAVSVAAVLVLGKRR